MIIHNIFFLNMEQCIKIWNLVDNIHLKNWGYIKMLKIKDNVDLKDL